MHLLAISPGEGWNPPRWRCVLHSGIDALMVREKQLSARALLDLVRRIQDLRPDLPLWVNGRADVALLAQCGYHAPETGILLPGLLPHSQPLHHPDQWLVRQHADQLILSPVFSVPGKGEPWGIPRTHAFLSSLPATGPRLLALGGLSPECVSPLRHPRLAGIAVIRALWDSEDPQRVVSDFRRAWAD